MIAASLPNPLHFDVSLLPDEWWVFLLTDPSTGRARYEISMTAPITRTRVRWQKKLRGAGGASRVVWEKYRHHYFLVTIPVQGEQLVDQTAVKSCCTVAQFKAQQVLAFERHLETEAMADPFADL